MGIFIGILFGALGLLLQWWLNREKSGRKPTAKQVRNTEAVFGKIEKIKAVAVSFGGCRAQGIDADSVEEGPEEWEVGAGGEQEQGGPFDVLTEQMYRMVTVKFIIPYVTRKLQDLPGISGPEMVDPKKWEEWMVKQIKDSQST